MYASGRRKEKENADWDYDDSEYPSYSVKEETSIFLMTGPRGSGKSTCLLGLRRTAWNHIGGNAGKLEGYDAPTIRG